MEIGQAEERDLEGILPIYNDAILTTTAVFSDEPVTLENRREWLEARAGQGYPVLVARDPDRTVLGFATFGDFRAWPGYRHTVEHSVYVRGDARGRGIGSALLEALFPLAVALDKHVLVAGIDASNDASIRLHERLGFERVGLLPEVGRKFDRWLDLAFLQKRL